MFVALGKGGNAIPGYKIAKTRVIGMLPGGALITLKNILMPLAGHEFVQIGRHQSSIRVAINKQAGVTLIELSAGFDPVVFVHETHWTQTSLNEIGPP
ncbi:hypothetical protein XMM379_000985 [Aliiroseovarius sp. xm-m-379]|nr:hypothetical protein [Aliiroseovarius sp. xm-m-379]NRP33103.1 hypothetical protein [Aliiroseovarius sp. xm-a-104]NRP49452.1 hypothetical protein [Aliiroseovarius sp. xm-m-354]NRQ04206.1 hypothetical protein [Aliiroseovarius sp. xm-m-309]NRQ07410.1 hypothetical protein [Aliiroseovarius sp. xm-v-201]NRQ20223.1 hypothetical protein [Aliiroseovarius sp. xm-v-204]NRQ24768.1 hypothetical protein [Aliiroseovarius sp. xm-g-7]